MTTAAIVHEIGKRSTESTCGEAGKVASLDWLITCPKCRRERDSRPAIGTFWARGRA